MSDAAPNPALCASLLIHTHFLPCSNAKSLQSEKSSQEFGVTRPSETRGKDSSVEIYIYLFVRLFPCVCFGVTNARQFTPEGADMPSASHSLQITPAFLREADLV